MTKRREFSKPVKVQILSRCKTETGFKCEKCGAIVATGEIDHTIAEALVVDKSRKLTAEDGKFLCWPCHQGPDGKTPQDKSVIARAKRREVAHLGIKSQSSRPIASRGFAKAEKPPRNGAVKIVKNRLPPRPLYEDAEK